MLKDSQGSQQLRVLLQLQPPVQSDRVRVGEYGAPWEELNPLGGKSRKWLVALIHQFDESVRIWDVKTGKCLKTLPAHSDPVSAVRIRFHSSFQTFCRDEHVSHADTCWPVSCRFISTETARWSCPAATTGSGKKQLSNHTAYCSKVPCPSWKRMNVLTLTNRNVSHVHSRIWDTASGQCLKTLIGELISFIRLIY